MAAQASGTAVASSGGTAGGMRETGRVRRDLGEFEHQNTKLNRGNDATIIRLQQFSNPPSPPRTLPVAAPSYAHAHTHTHAHI